MKDNGKQLALRWFEEVWNQRRVETIFELMAPDCDGRMEGDDRIVGPDEFAEYHRAFLNAVPDIHVAVHSAGAEGDRVYIEWRLTGTHLGLGLGIPPSGRAVDASGLTMFEFRDGQIAAGFDSWNRGELIASLMQVRIDELRAETGLTVRESQVALLMAERFTHTEIAAQLKIKPNTARRHCEKVLTKLGVSRRQDVALALGKIPGSVLVRQGSDLPKKETTSSSS